MSASAPARPIEFRNSTLGATVALLQLTEPAALADAMHKMLGGMPDFFNGEALVLDFSAAALPGRIDWAGLNSLMRRYRLQPIGVSNLAGEHLDDARRAGLAVLDAALLSERPAAPPAAAAAPPAAPPAAAPAPAAEAAAAMPTMFVDRTLRSGQQIYARDADLVLIGAVSPGAEVIADGSIHCYGPLRGRAIAGARGDPDARIFATHFGPELVSIAGTFRTFERGIPEAIAGRAAQVRLGSEAEPALSIERLQLD